MFKKILEKATKRAQSNDGSTLYELKSEITFLEGLIGCGKTHFVNNVVKKMGASDSYNSNFMLFDGRGEQGELADMLLKYGYNVFVINNNTKGKFVSVNRAHRELDISIYETDSDEAWQSLTTKPKTAIVAGRLDKEQLVHIVNRGIEQILKNDIYKYINVVAVFENIDFVLQEDGDNKEREETFDLVSGLLQKYKEGKLENTQTIFSFQDLSQISIFKEFIDEENRYQYIKFDKGTSSTGSNCFTTCEKIASNKAKVLNKSL